MRGGGGTWKCATILCRTLMRSNCARQAHYEPSLTSEQWGHSASSSPARKGQNKSRRLKAVSDFELERFNHPRTGLLSRDLLFGKSKLKLVGKGSLLQPCTALPDLAIRLHTVHLQLFFRNGAHRTFQYVCVFPTNHPGGTQYLTIVFLSFPKHLSYHPYNTLSNAVQSPSAQH